MAVSSNGPTLTHRLWGCVGEIVGSPSDVFAPITLGEAVRYDSPKSAVLRTKNTPNLKSNTI